MQEGDKLNDAQLAQEVAALMYAPSTRKIAPLIWAVERLIFPPELGAYTDKDVMRHLLVALREAREKHSTKPPQKKYVEEGGNEPPDLG